MSKRWLYRKTFGQTRIWPLVKSFLHKPCINPLQTWLLILSSLTSAANHGSKSVSSWVINSWAHHRWAVNPDRPLHSRPLGWGFSWGVLAKEPGPRQTRQSHRVNNYSRGTRIKDGLYSLSGMSLLVMAQFNSLSRTGCFNRLSR